MRAGAVPDRRSILPALVAATLVLASCSDAATPPAPAAVSTTALPPVLPQASTSTTVGPSPTSTPAPTPTTAAPIASSATQPPEPEPDTFGWTAAPVTEGTEVADVSLAIGAQGWLLGVSEDSYEAPTLWFSIDGVAWDRVAELPVTLASIGAPVVGVGPDEMVAIKIGDPEGAAFGEASELAVWVSSDGATWTEGDAGGFKDSGYLYDLKHTAAGWLAVGESYRNNHDAVPAIYHSVDGISWERVLRGDGRGAARAIAERDGQLLVIGSMGGRPAVWRSSVGTRWRVSRLPADTHGGEATAGAWLGDDWVVVGAGSETEAMSVWTSADGSSWSTAPPLVDLPENSPYFANRFGSGSAVDGGLAVSARRLRFAHENFCFAGEACFVTKDSVLLTSDGVTWTELPIPPRSTRQGGSDLPVVVAAADGRLAVITSLEGQAIVWTRSDAAEAPPIEQDPAVPELTIERAEWGDHLEAGIPYAWVMGTHCGIGQLGEFNDAVWQLEPDAPPPPPEVFGYGGIYGIIELSLNRDGDAITFTSGDTVVGVYHPQSGSPRLCM